MRSDNCVWQREAWHCQSPRLGCQLFINLDPGEDPGYTRPSLTTPGLIGLGNNNTHYTHGAVFPTSRESAPGRHGDLETARYCNPFEYYYRHLNWTCCATCDHGWSPPPLISSEQTSVSCQSDNKVNGKVLAVGILSLNSSIKLTFGNIKIQAHLIWDKALLNRTFWLGIWLCVCFSHQYSMTKRYCVCRLNLILIIYNSSHARMWPRVSGWGPVLSFIWI